MYKTINQSQFIDTFERMGRKDNFSYEGLELLFDYFEACEEDDKGFELDVIAICCDFAEATIDELVNDYNIDVSDCEDIIEKHAKVSDYLNYNTILVGECNNESYVYAKF